MLNRFIFIFLFASSISAQSTLQIEAEDYTQMQGIQLENNGTTVGYFDDGDWLMYQGVDFSEGYQSIAFETAKNSFGGSVELRIDGISGPLIAEFNPSGTGSWTRFETQELNIEDVSGIHDLYLLAVGVQGVCNLDYFVLNTDPVYEPNWVLEWSDEFDGTELNTNYWSKVHHGNPDNGEIQFYTPRPKNIEVSNGTLKLIAHKETYTAQGPWMSEPATREYTSGKIESLNKITFQYGRIEASMKLPRGKGTWPAFWMLGTNLFDSNVGWPKCGEIDIMEHAQDFDNLGAAIHTEAYNHTIGTQITGTYQIDDYDTGFHTYGCVWNSEELRFNVDGNEYLVVKKSAIGDSEAEWPFDQHFWLILNQAVGGAWGGTPDPSLYPHTVEVDWVRVYKDKQDGTTNSIEVVTPSEGDVSIFPNPTSGTCWIKLDDDPEGYTVVLQDLNGRELSVINILSKEQSVDLEGYAPGIYLLKLSKEGIPLRTIKVVKASN